MRKLSKEQLASRDQIVQALESTAEEIRQCISKVNAVVEEAQEHVGLLTNRYNELVQEANEFIEGIHDAQESYLDDRSDAWKEGDTGQGYEGWMDEWSTELDELEEVAFPDEIEEPDFNHADDLRDLPDAP